LQLQRDRACDVYTFTTLSAPVNSPFVMNTSERVDRFIGVLPGWALVWMNPYSWIEKVEEIPGSLYLAIEGATCWRVTENLPSILVFIVQAEPVALYIYHPFSCLFISDDPNFPLNTSV